MAERAKVAIYGGPRHGEFIISDSPGNLLHQEPDDSKQYHYRFVDGIGFVFDRVDDNKTTCGIRARLVSLLTTKRLTKFQKLFLTESLELLKRVYQYNWLEKPTDASKANKPV